MRVAVLGGAARPPQDCWPGSLLPSAWSDTGLAFTREDGYPIQPGLFTQHLGALVRWAGLSRIRLHDPRHAHATLALQAGVHPKVVSERLGHATVAFTLATYSHTITAPEEAAAEHVAELAFDA